MTDNIVAMKRKIDQEAIDALLRLVDRVKSGDVIGVYWVEDSGTSTRIHSAGTWDKPGIVFALEAAKFDIFSIKKDIAP